MNNITQDLSSSKVIALTFILSLMSILWINAQTEMIVEDHNNDGDAFIYMYTPPTAVNDARDMLLGFNQSNGGFVRMINPTDLGFWTNNKKRMVIRPSGFVGIGTSSPQTPLHVLESDALFGNRANILTLESKKSSRPALSFKNAGQFTTNYAGIEYKNFGQDQGLHFFYDDTTLMSVSEVGLTTFNHGLSNLGDKGLRIQNSDNNSNITFYTSAGSGNLLLYSSSSTLTGDPIGAFNATSGEYTALSDARVKKNFSKITTVLPNLLQLNPIKYHFLNENATQKKHIGLLAQEVEKYFPELVDYHTETDIYQMNYAGFGVLAIRGIQEQQEEIEALQKNNKKIIEEIESLKKSILSYIKK